MLALCRHTSHDITYVLVFVHPRACLLVEQSLYFGSGVLLAVLGILRVWTRKYVIITAQKNLSRRVFELVSHVTSVVQHLDRVRWLSAEVNISSHLFDHSLVYLRPDFNKSA